MIDIASLATNIWAALQPYLPILATKALEEIGKKVPEAVNRVWDAITKKFEKKPVAKESVDDLLRSPEDPDTQASFRKELKKVMAEDESFATELSKLLEAVGDTYKASLTGNGAIAQGPGAKAVGAGGVMVGGNVDGNIIMGNENTINSEPKKKNDRTKS